MSVIKYVGRKTDFHGKTLWELVGNLKNFGVGRIIVRSMFERYPEPSFMKILKVQAVPNEDVRKVRVTVERTFRGVKQPKPVVLYSTSYKADYRLLSEDEAQEYCTVTKRNHEQIIPRAIEFPPLLGEFVSEETGQQKPMMKLHFRNIGFKLTRQAKLGEQPTIKVGMGLGKPVSPSLYRDCL